MQSKKIFLCMCCIFNSLYYSLRRASIGFKLAAFTDGRSPKIRPISMENTTEPIIAGILIAVGAPDTWATTFDSIIPITTPLIHPILVSTEASVKNCPRMTFFLAPMAFFNPISLVRSVTDTSIIFITPMPPTRREILAIQISC